MRFNQSKNKGFAIFVVVVIGKLDIYGKHGLLVRTFPGPLSVPIILVLKYNVLLRCMSQEGFEINKSEKVSIVASQHRERWCLLAGWNMMRRRSIAAFEVVALSMVRLRSNGGAVHAARGNYYGAARGKGSSKKISDIPDDLFEGEFLKVVAVTRRDRRGQKPAFFSMCTRNIVNSYFIFLNNWFLPQQGPNQSRFPMQLLLSLQNSSRLTMMIVPTMIHQTMMVIPKRIPSLARFQTEIYSVLNHRSQQTRKALQRRLLQKLRQQCRVVGTIHQLSHRHHQLLLFRARRRIQPTSSVAAPTMALTGRFGERCSLWTLGILWRWTAKCPKTTTCFPWGRDWRFR